jgi:Tfp pilus assembly protein PilO
MDLQRLLSSLSAFAPVAAIAYAGYCYFDFGRFQSDPASEFGQKNSAFEQAKKEQQALERKNKEMIAFLENVQAKKAEVEQLAVRLSELKSALSDRVDGAEFMKLIITEAKKVGIVVLSVKPMAKNDTEFYREFPYELKFKGVFVQVYAFLSRVAAMQRLVRVDDFQLKSNSKSTSRFVELEGELKIKTFSYRGSKADELAQGESGKGGGK